MSIRGKTVSVASSLNITKESKPAKQFVGMIETQASTSENKLVIAFSSVAFP